MKKWIAAAALAACGAAQADVGPVYVSYPGFCNVKRIYMNTAGDIYGQEIGCSAILGAPMVGFISPNGSFIFSVRDGSGNACMHNYLATGLISAACSNGAIVNYPTPIAYSASISPPPQRSAKGAAPGEAELPRLPF